MKKKIKWIFALTVIATCSVILMQAFWLRSQYVLGMNQELKAHADSVFLKAESYWENYYGGRGNPRVGYMLSVRGKGSGWYTTLSSPDLGKIDRKSAAVDIDAKVKIIADSFDLSEPLPGQGLGSAITKQFSLIKWQNSPAKLERFLQKSFKDSSLKVTATDDSSRIWQYKIIEKRFFFSPRFTMIYGYSPLVRHNVLISGDLSVRSVLGQLGGLFIGAGVWTVLMILCLVYQARVLFDQYRIDTLRKNFSHTMIHELKRPVQSLKMLIAFLQDKDMQKDGQLYDKTLTDARLELDNLSAYFAKLRDVTYGDEKTIPLNKTVFDVGRLAEHSLRTLECPDGKYLKAVLRINGTDLLQRTNNAILVSEGSAISPGTVLLEMVADRIHIGNIINNLLENAVKYSQPSFVDILLSLTSSQEGLIIKIRDCGKGISNDECQHIFEKFYRSRSVTGTDIPGIGLGLSYVKLLVEAHGGTVSVKSELGRYTEFTIRIPQRKDGEPARLGRG